MRPARFSVVLVPLLVLALAACGGSSAAPSTDDGGNGGNGGNTPAASTDNGGPDSTPGNGNGSGDAEGVAANLVPPNSSQITQTTAEGTYWTVYESTDSPDSLKGFYENAISQTGMQIFSTTTADGTYSWLFAENDGSSFGGSVTVGPASDGGGGSSVIVIVSDGS